jgi:sugar lactone lactonase YvrE
MKNLTLQPLTGFLAGLRSTTVGLALATAGLMLLARGNVYAVATVTTIGGGSISAPYYGYVNGNTLSAAKFNMPSGMALDASGTTLYIADYTNNAVRLVSSAGNTGSSVTSTWATNGVSHPIAVVLGSAGDVYVLNHGTGANGAVLHFTGAGSTAVAQPSLATGLANATAMAIDGAGNLYVTVNGNGVIRVTPTGSITNIGTISQSGTSLQGIVVLDTGNLALTDAGNNGIWNMNPVTGVATKFTGFHGAADVLGSSGTAAFNTPETLAEAGGGILVVADRGNNKVKLVDPAGNVSLLYGVSSSLWVTGINKYPGWADGAAGTAKGSAESRQPNGVVVAPDGSVFADEDYYHVLRHITGTGLTTPPPPGTPNFGGSGNGSGGSGGGGIPQTFTLPAGIAYDSIDNYLLIANATNNSVQVLNLNLSTNANSTFLTSADGLTNPVALVTDPSDNLYVLNQGVGGNGFITEYDIYGNTYGAIVTGLNHPTALTIDGLGNLFVTEQAGKIRSFGASVSNTIVTITNAGVSLQGIAFFDDGTIAVSDAGNQVIWAVNPITRQITKLTGQFGLAGSAVGNTNFARFNQPRQLVRVGGDEIVGADSGNNRLVLIQRNGTVTTNHFNYLTGATVWYGNNNTDPITTGPTFINISGPFGVTVDSAGNIFDSEPGKGLIRRVIGTTLAAPSSSPAVPVPTYGSIGGLALNNTNTVLYVTDATNDTVSAVNLLNNGTSIFLDSSSGIYDPVDVGVDANNNVYVLNQGTGGNGSIMEFDQFGNPVGLIAQSLPLPTAMKLDFNGNIYVAEQNGMVQLFNSSGSNTVATVTTNANVRLTGIALLDNGAIVVSDPGNQVLWKIPSGSSAPALFTGILGTPGATLGTVGFAKVNNPMGLAEAQGGQVVIVDAGNNRLVVANDAGTISTVLNSTNAEIWFGQATDPIGSTSPNFVPMLAPTGIAISSAGIVFASETVYRDVRGLLGTGISAPAVPTPPGAPRIGWFDYEGNDVNGFFTVLHPVSISTFNNDESLAIDPTTNGVSTYYLSGPAPITSQPSATNGSTPPFYQDGLAYAQALPPTTTPDLLIKAVNVNAIGQASPVTTAEFRFQVANPTITGFNGAAFTVSEITSNSVFWYTLDGTDPTNAPPSVGPISMSASNSALISISVTSNTVFRARAFRNGYYPSGVAVQAFSPSNFVANTISFGFASGEASSDFIASPGQTFYAPVTLTLLPSAMMYSLQFNIVATNAGPNAGPALAPGAFGFQSMLVKPDPENAGQFIVIPPYMFANYNTGPINPSQLENYGGTNFVNLVFTNTSINLLGVGWLERYSETNLYPTRSQDLIEYSIAHDDVFPQSGGKVILGGYAFSIPKNAVANQTYQIQINRPSATSDGIGAPGSDVFIEAPTNGATAGGSPINALKYVTVGQRKYIAGSVYPFRWFNAGDFGSTNIVDADVEQVFQSAIYFLNSPPPGSDFFDGMDSAGSYGYLDSDSADANYGYYTNANVFLNTTAQTYPLFDGNDSSINQVAFGDGNLDVCDVYVTYRRSLDPSLTWYERFWNNGQLVADTNAPNVASHVLTVPTKTFGSPKVSNNSTSPVPPQVDFFAGQVIGQAGQIIAVPINATVLGNYPLRMLMLNLTVEPLDGSPALTAPVTFHQTATLLGNPYTTASQGNGNFAAVWLNSTNAGLTGTVTLGTLYVTIPASAGSSAAYAIHFDHASASPNGLGSFPNLKVPGLLTTSARTNSTYGDGIPDSWRLQWFGTVYNVLSTSNACPSGDGVPNWKKFIAGVDPNVANDFPSVNPRTPMVSAATNSIQWPSVNGRHYVIERAPTLYGTPWTVLSTNTGTGGVMEYDDGSAGGVQFYRVEIYP